MMPGDNRLGLCADGVTARGDCAATAFDAVGCMGMVGIWMCTALDIVGVAGVVVGRTLLLTSGFVPKFSIGAS